MYEGSNIQDRLTNPEIKASWRLNIGRMEEMERREVDSIGGLA